MGSAQRRAAAIARCEGEALSLRHWTGGGVLAWPVLYGMGAADAASLGCLHQGRRYRQADTWARRAWGYHWNLP
jgi:hypothetical protein